MLDRDLSTLTIESHYIDMASQKETDGWESLPLSELRKIYTSDVQKQFLEQEIVAKSLPGHLSVFIDVCDPN